MLATILSQNSQKHSPATRGNPPQPTESKKENSIMETIAKIWEKLDEKLWNATIEKVTIYDNGNLIFHFKNGAEITKSL